MGAGFTPGPWGIYAEPVTDAEQAMAELREQVELTKPLGNKLYFVTAGGKCPAITGCGPTSEANAHLIAAAPELYEALDGLLAEFEKFSRYGSPIARSANEPTSRAKAALAKARGEQP